jgi:hypothetical protein
METQTQNLSFENVWLMFQETDKKFRESQEEIRRSNQETDKKFSESQEEIRRRSEETERFFRESRDEMKRRSEETERFLRESQEEIRRSNQETDRRISESHAAIESLNRRSIKRFKELETLFTGQWGKLIESLIEGKLVELLRNRGIMVNLTYTHVESLEKDMEIDIVAQNGEEIVVVEVKTTLKVDSLEEFKEKLVRFKDIFPHYKENKIYGAVAYLRAEEGVLKRAVKDGFYVIKATGDSARIINKENFKPKEW